MSACRSCGAPITWARYAGSGRRIPLDPQAVDDGNLYRLGRLDRGDIVVEVVKRGQLVRDPLRFVTHLATCPKAAQHRKTRA